MTGVETCPNPARFSMEDEMALFQYFGTFPRCMLTMFQFTLGTWVPVARVLQEIVSPFTVLGTLFCF